MAPTNGGKQTELTLSMSAHEIHVFMLLLKEGNLAQLGIETASITPTQPTGTGKREWTQAERDKRSKLTDTPESDLP